MVEKYILYKIFFKDDNGVIIVMKEIMVMIESEGNN